MRYDISNIGRRIVIARNHLKIYRTVGPISMALHAKFGAIRSNIQRVVYKSVHVARRIVFARISAKRLGQVRHESQSVYTKVHTHRLTN